VPVECVVQYVPLTRRSTPAARLLLLALFACKQHSCVLLLLLLVCCAFSFVLGRRVVVMVYSIVL